MEFEDLLEPVFADAVRFSRALAGSATEGDDLLQDGLVRALRGFRRLRDRSRFRAWLFRILGNTHRTRARKAAMRRWLGLERAGELPAPAGLGFEEKDAVRRALRDVPAPQREALILFEVVGLSIDEIAEIQRASISAVKSRLARGRIRLQERYRALEVWHARPRS